MNTLDHISTHAEQYAEPVVQRAFRALIVSMLQGLPLELYEAIQDASKQGRRMSAPELAQQFERSLEQTSTDLGNLHAYGLICRKRIGRRYEYWIEAHEHSTGSRHETS